MTDYSALVWITQLGMSVAAPLAGCILLAVWLKNQFSLGNWVIIVGLILGVSGAVEGLRSSIKAMMIHQKHKKKETPPPVAFNDHH